MRVLNSNIRRYLNYVWGVPLFQFTVAVVVKYQKDSNVRWR